MNQPMQPVIRDANGVPRFQANAVVKYLLEHGPYDMNSLALLPFTDEDRAQFAQLVGYSVSGFGELSYVSDNKYEEAHLAAEKLSSND